MNKKNPERPLDEIIGERFNNIFYKRYLKRNTLELRHNLVATYLCDNIDASLLSQVHYGKAIFASFAKKYLPDGSNLDSMLVQDDGLRFSNDVNTEPVVEYCILRIGYKECDADKPRLRIDKLHALEPNNAAMMAGILYAEIFRNKNLLRYVRTAKDADDLKALLFIDYIFRSTRNAGIDDILDGRGCLESKALKVAAKVMPRFLEHKAVVRDDYARALAPAQYTATSSNIIEIPKVSSPPAIPPPNPPTGQRSLWRRAALAIGLGTFLVTSAFSYAEYRARNQQQEMLQEHCKIEPWNQYCTGNSYKKK